MFPRRRHVRGVPTFLNEILRPTVMARTASLKRHYFYSHSTAELSQRKLLEIWRRMEADGTTPHLLSDDISGFDTSVPAEHLRQINHSMKGLTDLERYALDLLVEAPVISGPLHQGDHGYIYSRKGVLPSGSIDTALTGTRINLCCVIDCYAAGMGWSVSESIEAFEQQRWGVLLLGDDTCLVVDARLDRDAYTKRALELGYKRRLEEYPVFLMTWLGLNSPPFGLSSRAAIRTASREHLAAGPVTELLATWIRWARCLADPTFEQHWRLIRRNPLFEEHGISEFDDLRRICEQPWVQDAFAKEVSQPQGDERWTALLADLTEHGLSNLGEERRALALLQRIGGVRNLADTHRDRAAIVASISKTNWRTLLAEEFAVPEPDQGEPCLSPQVKYQPNPPRPLWRNYLQGRL